MINFYLNCIRKILLDNKMSVCYTKAKAIMKMKQLFLFLLFLMVRATVGLFIEGCPLYGCRPSGTFSMYLNITRINASIAWESSFSFDPVPEPLGCVADDVNIICQSNGKLPDDTGYVSLNALTGGIQWRDKLLKFPTLPLLDNYGDVTGSDGTRLVHYDADGKTYPVIPCEGLKPLISLQLVGTDFLLLISGSGLIVARATNGVPVGYIKLDYVIDGLNGTFIPVSRPVVNGNRFYVLTTFTSSVDTLVDANLQRLFAIDIHHTLDKRITIAWFYDFPPMYGKSEVKSKGKNVRKSLPFGPTYDYESQVLLWDGVEHVVYVNLAPKLDNHETKKDQPQGCLFWAIRDSGNQPSLSYCNKMAVKHMTKFEANDGTGGENAFNKNELLWIFTNDGYLRGLGGNGTVVKSLNLNTIFGTTINITSKVVLAKADDNGPETLIFAFEAQRMSQNIFSRSLKIATNGLGNNKPSSGVVAIRPDVDVHTSDVILWMVPVPENMRVRGQISGSSGSETQTKDKLIFYAETADYAKIFAIN